MVSPNSTRLVDIVGIFPNILQNFRGGGVQKSSFAIIPIFDPITLLPLTRRDHTVLSSVVFTKMRRWGGVEGEGGVGLNSCMQNRPLFQQNTTRRYTCDT